MNFKKLVLQFGFVLGLLLGFSSCGFDRYNAVTQDTEDLNADNERVYGESKDAPPRQAGNEYPAPEDGAKRAAEIKKKFLGLDKEEEKTAPVSVTNTDSSEMAKPDSTVLEN